MRAGLFRYGKGGLWPANGRTREALREAKLAEGALISAQVLRSRNPRLCALANAVICELADGFGVPRETIVTRLKELLGFYDIVVTPDGVEKRARSFAFEDLPDEDAFIEFWRAAEALACSELVPCLGDDEQRAVLAMLDGRRK